MIHFMPTQNQGLHHFHRRKRIYQNHEPYPHPNKWKRFMDKLIYVVGIVVPIMTVPQFLKIWVDKNAQGISLISWVTYAIASLFWAVYGVMHKEKPIILTSSLLLILDAFIVVGAIIYG